MAQNKDSTQLIEEIRQTFKLFDQNGDGRISTEEIGSVLRALGQNPTDEQISDFISEIDSDGNGYLEFLEFVEAVKGNMPDQEAEERDMRAAFQVFDRDGNGYIDSKEIQFVVGRLGNSMTDDDIKEIMREADQDSDGKIDYNEFVKVICRKQ